MIPVGSSDSAPAPQAPKKSSGRLRQIWWASVPVWSIGFLSFVPFLAFAAIQRRARDWAVFAAYLAATIAMIVAIGAVNSDSGAGEAVGGLIIALAGCAMIHSFILFRPSRGQLTPIPAGPTGPQERNREAVAEAKYAFMRKTIHYAAYGLLYLVWIMFGMWFFLNSPMGVFGPTLSKVVKAPPNGCGGVCPGAPAPLTATFMAAPAGYALCLALMMLLFLFAGEFKKFRVALVQSIACAVVYAGAFSLRYYVGWKNF